MGRIEKIACKRNKAGMNNRQEKGIRKGGWNKTGNRNWTGQKNGGKRNKEGKKEKGKEERE